MSRLRVVSQERKREIERRIDTERLFAVIGTTGNITDQVAGIADGLYEGGVSTSEITCRAATWLNHLEALQHYKDTKNPDVIVAVGTNTDIFSAHQAMQSGAEVIVAAHELMPYSNRAAVPPERRSHLTDLETFIQNHEEEIKGLYKEELGEVDAYALMMDPIMYVSTRGGIIIPASSHAPDGLKAVKMRGANYQKLYPTQRYTPAELAETFKAVTPFDNLRVVLTGGLDKDNMVPWLKVPYVIAAGMSYLAKGTPREIRKKAKNSREIVKSLEE